MNNKEFQNIVENEICLVLEGEFSMTPREFYTQLLKLRSCEDIKLINAKNKIGQVAEGARTLEVVYHEANKMNVSMPLANSLYEILYANASSDQLIQDLLEHPNDVDVEFIYQDKL